MNDDLEAMSDSELSARVALEVAGWFCMRFGYPEGQHGQQSPGMLSCDPSHKDACWHNGHSQFQVPPPFATSADAVLPWLEKQGWKCAGNRAGQTSATTVFVVCHQSASQEGFAVSCDQPNDFARAACIALIRAKRLTNPGDASPNEK